jgi:RNA polymerase sigma-70 factor (ECF subfamily)
MPAHSPVSGRIAFEAAPPANEELSSDEALVLGIRRGDLEVGRRMYRRVIRVVEATLRRVVGRDETDHEDLLQMVFEEIVSTIHSGRFAMRCSLTSWAASIACHVGLNAIRARRMDRRVFERKPADGASNGAEPSDTSHPQSLERTLEARDELRQVRLALAELVPARAEAVLLHDVMGYALKEVAEITGVSVGAAQSRLARGRADLSQQLANGAQDRGRE